MRKLGSVHAFPVILQSRVRSSCESSANPGREQSYPPNPQRRNNLELSPLIYSVMSSDTLAIISTVANAIPPPCFGGGPCHPKPLTSPPRQPNQRRASTRPLQGPAVHCRG